MKIGDKVCFLHGHSWNKYGEIVRINKKTITIKVNGWVVPNIKISIHKVCLSTDRIQLLYYPKRGVEGSFQIEKNKNGKPAIDVESNEFITII